MAKHMFANNSGGLVSITDRPDGTAVLKVLAGGKHSEHAYKSFREAQSAMRKLGSGWKEQK